MLLTLETIGNWNPQLFRELKGRFNFRKVTIAASISILGQSLLVAIISAPSYTDSWEINSQKCFNIFQSLNWILPIILVLGGAYMLIGDMAKEERRGTLNFIRLTPQPSQSVLIGKILGVPVLLYFAIALALPLHLRKKEKKGRKTIFSAFPFGLRDLILGEKSHALVAIAINIAITAAIWIPWVLLLPEQNNSLFNIWAKYSKNQVILTLFLTANLILICAAIAQLILLMKTRKPEIWAATAVSAVIILPLVTMAALGFTFDQNPDWFLISVFAAIAIPKTSTTAIFLTILGQWSVLALLSLQLTRQLRKIGESNSKSLLAVRPSLPASSN